jgi:hypothetical protein
MACCYHFSEVDRNLWVCYPSEPALALAAACLLRTTKVSWAQCIHELIPILKVGAVEGGFRGELVCKILLMFAWDKCQSNNFQYHYPVTVNSFLQSLGGEPLITAIKESNKPPISGLDKETYEKEKEISSNKIARFLNGTLFFTHFTYVTNSITTADQLEYFCRNGQAVFCKLGQKGLDLLIPVVLADEEAKKKGKSHEFTFIAIQCKNHVSYTTDDHEKAQTTYTASNFGFKDFDLPYLVLFMSIGAETNFTKGDEKVRSLIPTKEKTSPRVKACKFLVLPKKRIKINFKC